jgi:DNA-binding transcriptional ArsR family regulator
MTTKFHGMRRICDVDTGDIMNVQVVDKSVGDRGFKKIWMAQILDLVDEVGNAKMKVLAWLIDEADSKNQVLATLTEIAEATDTSRATVQRLMSVLKKANVIAETRRSLWRLNPDVVFAGSHDKRMSVLIRYNNEKQKDLFDEAPEPVDAPVLRRVA